MKTKIILIAALLAAFVTPEFAQSLRINTKKVTYKRGKAAPAFKRSFTIEYPKVSGAMGKKIEKVLDFEKNFDFKIQEEIKELFWLENASYTVNYNKNSILNVTLFIEGSGAYPSGSNKHLTVNIKNGMRVKPSDVFTNLNGLAALVKKAQQAEMKKEAERIKKDEPDFDPGEYFNQADFKAENLWSFTLDEKGVTFHYDYGFPHVALALQPDGDFFYKWSELKPFIKTDGLFGVFVK